MSTVSRDGTRFETISSDDQGANLWIVTLICLSFSIAGISARTLSKIKVGFKITADDFVIAGALVLVTLHCSLMMKALVLGLGKNADLVDSTNVEPILRYFIAAQCLYLAALYAVKCSMLLLISRTFDDLVRMHWILLSLPGIASIVAIVAGCHDFECANSNPLPRWIVVIIFDILTELLIIILPILRIRAVQMENNSKFKVILSFSSRFSVIVFSLLTIWALSRILRQPSRLQQPTTEIVLPTVFQQLELTVSISIASILPCFRLLFQTFEDDLIDVENSQVAYNGSSITHMASIGMESAHGESNASDFPRSEQGSVTSHKTDRARSAARKVSTSSLGGSWGSQQPFAIHI